MALILLAGLGAGVINAIVGSGTLITFPALVAFGVPPVAATMSNAVGLVPGNITSSIGYRKELAGQKKRLLQLIPASLVGALTGAWLLLHLPETAFETIVPVLLVLALVMVVTQPALQRWIRRRKAAQLDKDQQAGDDSTGRSASSGDSSDVAGDRHNPGHADGGGQPHMSLGRTIGVITVVFLTGIYGGYFAAAQGILLIGFLGLLLPETLQRINGAKNILVLVVNAVAATTYVVVGFDRINWLAVLLIAIGSMIGGSFGARIGRRLSPVLLRVIIVILGLVALWRILEI
ncbi:sulfite exporter TauE/SafE family protein [Saxibacter everestensis]|uniref:Probable membrane transporter protein n=2 Tax=Saxibacter everestensis TaxID=2909229 RepID=A0ABY8QYI5_9MICO|nr:sulfite exporter TauE/SafE family protein [Brevibacteriaceae bacterium ZFBP1038]